MQTVQDTIEQLYLAFSTIAKPQHIDGCPCCLDKKEIVVLLAKSLRTITPKELSPYASSAFLTVGERADYLYFLPRILEISATDTSWWPDPEVTGRAIRRSNTDSWNEAQLSCLKKYLEVLIGSFIALGDYYPLDSWLCAIARMRFDVMSYLGQIAENTAAVLSYFEQNADSLPQNKLSNAFWELPCSAHDTIVNWFFSPDIAKIPFDAYGCVLTRAN